MEFDDEAGTTGAEFFQTLSRCDHRHRRLCSPAVIAIAKLASSGGGSSRRDSHHDGEPTAASAPDDDSTSTTAAGRTKNGGTDDQGRSNQRKRRQKTNRRSALELKAMALTASVLSETGQRPDRWQRKRKQVGLVRQPGAIAHSAGAAAESQNAQAPA